MNKKMIDRFIRKYTEAVIQGNAAVFGGAGLSRESGYVNWKELLREFADNINLDVDKETDLISVAQYYKNENYGNRFSLNKGIIDQFTKEATYNRTMESLAKLPIHTYWTTNYDHVIEDTLNNNHKYVDCKRSERSLALNKTDSDVIVYKIHGDIDEPDNAVLTKDDYELFEKTHKLFTTALQADLISKTFVFVGYSFSDPNLWQILSRIRILIGESVREHFYFIEDIKEENYKSDKEYLYDTVRQDLMIKDLKRYGIQTVLIDSYKQLPIFFDKIHARYLNRRIFIAGSCRNYGDWSEKDAGIFLASLGYELAKDGFQVSTGYVEGVGPQVANGVLNAINEFKLNLEKTLVIKPLPLIHGSAEHMKKDSKKMFQDNMISEVGIVIFLFGNNYYDGELKNSKGVYHDYERALEQKKYIIPVGSTGYCAEQILSEIEEDIGNYPYLKPFLSELKTEKEPEKLVKVIMNVINEINKL